MTSFTDELTDQLNLRWAWEKVRRQATPGDNWFDEVEVAAFELDLEQNLQIVADRLRKGRYRLTALRPLPFPKDSDENDNPRVRQVFQIAVQDQVAWTALVNLVGPYVDSKMPAWSYGNRLYRTIWVEEDADGLKRRKIGRYRHATGNLYLPFGQSWPVFRRHVYLATRAMAFVNGEVFEQLDDPTEEELHFQERLKEEHRCPFVMPAYWFNRHPQSEMGKLYWCSIDLEKFYPSLNLEAVRENIVEHLPPGWKDEARQLLLSMLEFRLDCREWTSDDLLRMDLSPDKEIFEHIPTGLYVSGFLANAGMLKVDLQVVELLKVRNVAHFRFVDDHLLLAYSFRELVEWVRDYAKLLSSLGTGARLNPQKIEPKELAPFVIGEKLTGTEEENETQKKRAESKCRLDPQFPSPLMTKTLALVSAIARTDFNLLESEELAALTDQLELLLLVDIPNEEIPDKTRLSFAATRLTRIAECWLSNPQPKAELNRRHENLDDQLKHLESGNEKYKELEQELKEVTRKLTVQENILKHKVDRSFQLLRKVLRERPDRTRLWTRALLMCRLTGVKGIAHLLADIRRESLTNPLAGAYLQANILILLGEQALVAARILQDEGIAHWRRLAARSFLEEVCVSKIDALEPSKARWFLRLSWLQYCSGLYCADLVLRDGVRADIISGISFPEEQIAIGRECSTKGSQEHSAAQWAWWVGRVTLRDLEAHAAGFVKVLGEGLKGSTGASAFWRFFPLDVPTPTLSKMAKRKLGGKHDHTESGIPAGWWFDALRYRQERPDSLPLLGHGMVSSPVRRMLASGRHDLSLYEWCDRVRALSHEASSDPRSGEWTALEIVRQIAILVDKEPTLGAKYLRDTRKSKHRFPSLHPANFRVPKNWLEKQELTWNEWQERVHETKIEYVSKSDRIEDNRYTPLNLDSPLFRSINPVRGLGLLLFGLLRKSFDLPASWNGPGHADVLGMLPKLLLKEMTCSSWTFGVLAASLQVRGIENLFLKALPPMGDYFDDDTLRDPIALHSARDVRSALATCQKVLERNQLSTMNQRARQLTPVSILQLTQPEWTKDFERFIPDEGGIGE